MCLRNNYDFLSWLPNWRH